jgi:hypothetical protein
MIVPTLESFEATIFITWNQVGFLKYELGYVNLPFAKKGDYKRKKMHVNGKNYFVLTLLDFMNS